MRPFATESAYPLLTAEEAWEVIADNTRPLRPTRVPLEALSGLVLAEDVVAACDLPAFAASSMDGYALRAGDGDAPRRVLGEVQPGAGGGPLGPGECVRIMTGAPLPVGADAVLAVELTREDGGLMLPRRAARPGENVRSVGEDVAAGTRVLAAGNIIGPAEVGLLASLNRATALAYPRPRVAILSTGNELVSPGEPLGPGQIPDSNAVALAAAVSEAGFPVAAVRRARDSEAEVRGALLELAGAANVLVTSGGVSMGTGDYVKPLLAALGEVYFGRVAIKPGKPLTFARLGETLVFGLPGNPVSSLVIFEVYVRPALRMMGAQKALFRPIVPARVSQPLGHEADRTEFQRSRLTWRDGVWWADSTGSQISSRLLSLRGANALLRIPQGMGDVPAGATVAALRIDQPEVEARA